MSITTFSQAPDVVFVSGAGSTNVNGLYTKQGLNGGVNYYSKGSYFIYRRSDFATAWYIGTVLNSIDAGDIYYNDHSTSNTPVGVNFGKSSNNFQGSSPFPTVSLATASIATNTATNITTNSVELAGNVISDSGLTVTERGIVYSTTNQTPEIGKTGVIKDTNGTGLGVFSETISSLNPETTYYYRAYAINSAGTGYGVVRSFTTLGVSISSITRQNPSIEDLFDTSATYQVTFTKPVKDVDITDFTSNSTGATVNSVTSVSNTVYNVALNNINTNGDVFLQTKGVAGVAGSNDITTLAVPTETTTVDQQNTNDWLGQAEIGQTFTASTSGIIKSVTFYPNDGNHTFSGTADLKLYSGVSNDGGTEIDSESVTVTNSSTSAGQTFTFASPVTLSSGQTYTITLSNFSGSGSHALNANTSNVYNGGHVIFAGMNSSSHLNFDLKIKIVEEATLVGDVALSTTAPATNEKFIKKSPPAFPVLTTADASTVSETNATLGGTIVLSGASAITERGIVYSTTDSYPKIGETGVTKVVSAVNTNTFSDVVSSLNTKNIYFYRAYAINSNSTGYGAVKRFSLNNAFHFDGVHSASVPNHNYTNGFSMDVLLKPDQFSGSQCFLARFVGGKVFAFIIKSDGTVESTISTDGAAETYFTTVNSLTEDVWQHVAFTYNNADGAMKLYINGVDAGGSGSVTNPTSGALFHESSNQISIGSRNGSPRYEGAVDELRIWNKTLSSTTINQIKNKTVPSNADGLLAYYQFNQGVAGNDNTSISQLFNSKSNSFESLLNNFTRNGSTSNFIAGASGDFDNNTIAKNAFMASGNWSDPTKWSLGKVPTQIENAIIAENQTVTIDVDDLEIDDFELETGATLNIPNDKEITINNTFTSSGNLSLASDKNDSGVLLVNGSISGNVTYVRGGLLANKWSIVTPPVSGQTIKSFAENNANDIRQNTGISPVRYAIAYYDDTKAVGSKWVYYDTTVNATDTFTAGTSYSMSRATDGSVTFVGTLAVDDINKTLNADEWQAIGNPFTTYYPANKNSNNSFLNENFDALDDSFKSLYVWDAIQEKYVAVSEVDANDRSLPPGQGFFIKMKTGQTNVSFNKAKRTTKPASGITTFEKGNVTPNIVVNVSKGKTTVKTRIKFFDNTTNGFDTGFDIGNFDSHSLDIYSRIVDNSVATNLTIQSLPKDNYENIIIPLGIVAKKGDNITIDGILENLPQSVYVYLEDRLQNSFTDLKTSKKQWTVENDISGVGRFYLRLSGKALSTATNELTGVSLFESNHQLHIYGLQNDASLRLYSISGKAILSSKVEGIIKTTIDLPELATGVYIANLQTEQGTISKKIIIK
ncbi:hypothetical protein BTO18_16835 [Polaribacter porphyrae]|uniref:LamG-like jellyroll fold domain-containing protein n=2 Tax=Polaribacter porphyrae TaxID=1137780 RepID=A0A2S7WT14_9FLAO|nr:LamG-like jellyroll fold domain-containing protein [Polaribacter porphyrae]PQJ80733.1 hypothetical protein BTO18_16835 [Polaribacter porphyrae]